MISIPDDARVVLAIRPVDFRKGAHALAALTQQVVADTPLSYDPLVNLPSLAA